MCKAPRIEKSMSFNGQDSPPMELITRTSPISQCTLDKMGITEISAVFAELAAGSELYQLATRHIAQSEKANARSFSFDVSTGGGERCDERDSNGCETSARGVACSLGLGIFKFSFNDKGIIALHQTIDHVVGSNCGPGLLKSLVLVAEGDVGDISVLKAFCTALLAEADKTKAHTFTVYRFHNTHHYWMRGELVEARPMESVVLPKALKSRVTASIDEFLAPGTKQFYREHGIPYKTSLLFFGAPGAGKTSLIQAIAGRYQRNVCYLSPSHPDMTDDALKSAVQRVPSRSIIVLEDVDALFESGRTKSSGDKSALTFSGVLNALDGVGGALGQIFILTTNHRERLDPALIRKGRVDLHVEFADAVEEQMRDLFKAFYQSATDAQAADFAGRLCALLGERTVSMAALQSYFIGMRRKTAAEAIENVEKIIEEAEAHGGMPSTSTSVKSASSEAKGDAGADEEKEVEAGQPGSSKDKTKDGRKKDAVGNKNGAPVHVHVHMHHD